MEHRHIEKVLAREGGRVERGGDATGRAAQLAVREDQAAGSLGAPLVRRLLIADDEEAIVFAMKEYFETQGYGVDVARSKDEALALLAVARYDVVIADLRMSPAGPADGLGLAAAVKRLAPETRTVILTAYGSPEAREQARRVGVDAFLHKPERLKDVAAVVRGLTGLPTA